MSTSRKKSPSPECRMPSAKHRVVRDRNRREVVFLFDVDNTLLDNDRVTADLKSHLEQKVGRDQAQRYWDLFEQMRAELGYADYLGALQRYRSEHPHDPNLLTVSRFLVN